MWSLHDFYAYLFWQFDDPWWWNNDAGMNTQSALLLYLLHHETCGFVVICRFTPGTADGNNVLGSQCINLINQTYWKSFSLILTPQHQWNLQHCTSVLLSNNQNMLANVSNGIDHVQSCCSLSADLIVLCQQILFVSRSCSLSADLVVLCQQILLFFVSWSCFPLALYMPPSVGEGTGLWTWLLHGWARCSWHLLSG